MSRQDILYGIAQMAAINRDFLTMRVGDTWLQRHMVWELRNVTVQEAHALIISGKGIESLT